MASSGALLAIAIFTVVLMFFFAKAGVGILAGILAAKGTNSRHGLLISIPVGVGGAYLGGYCADAVGLDLDNSLLGTMLVSMIGAVVLLVLLQAIKL